MFDSMLRPAAARRPFGTGAAIAVAIHAWLLVLALGHARSAAAEDKAPPPTLDLVLASAPPKLGGSGPMTPSPPKKAPRKVRDPQGYHPPNPDLPKTATPPPDSPPPADDTDPPGDGETKGGGGDCVGNCTGTGSGVENGDPNGVVGGTGTVHPAAPPPPTYTLLNIGDPALDQSTCQVYGTPPYPREALAAKVEGIVLARCTVEPDGSLSGCTVLKAPYSFETPVKTWLSGAKARPFTSSGRPVRVPCNFKFNYKVE